MTDWFVETAGSGSLLLAVPVALVAGLVSFFSPCVIPLLPGYLSYATGLSGADLQDNASQHRGRLLLGSSLFVVGFSAVFVILGVFSGLAGELVTRRHTLSIVLGVVSIVLGLVFMGVLPIFQRDVRVHRVPAVGIAAAPLLGFLFGLGWTPCVGPTLATILSLSVNEGTAARGGVLSAFFALGIGLPFLFAALFYERMLGAVKFIRKHQQWVTRIGGLMMVVVGLLLVTGLWADMVTWLQLRLIAGFEVPV